MTQNHQILAEGTEIFYIVGTHVFSGKAVDIEITNTGFTFAIDSYGACEGNFKIDSSMIGICVFLNHETAQRLANDPEYTGGFKDYC